MMVAMFFGRATVLAGACTVELAGEPGLILQFPVMHHCCSQGRAGVGWRGLPRPTRADPVHHHLRHHCLFQLLLLFAAWPPSGIVWWQAEGGAFGFCGLYAATRLLLKASFDAGAEVQSGALG